MNPEYIRLGDAQLVFAALLVLINAVISFTLRLGLERSLLIASARTVGQLLLVGMVLRYVFLIRAWPLVLLLGLFMTVMAGVSAVRRTGRRYRGIYGASFLSTLVSSFLVTGFAVTTIIGVKPWYDPQYLIPLLGMILGNTLNGISLGLDRMLEGVASRRDQIESLLALGATRWEAALELLQEAVRTGMVPTINSMMVIGIVSLPGMMTGQLLAGAAPSDAVRYQIIIMFLIAAGTALGTLGVSLFAYRAIFNRDHQLLASKVERPGERPQD